MCSIESTSPAPSDFRLLLDLDYVSRKLAKEERDAVRLVFDSCCVGEKPCAGWRQASKFTKGSSEDDEVPVLDLCHLAGSFCGRDGRLRRLDMTGFGLECDFPTTALTRMAQLEKLLLSSNTLSGDVAKIAEGLKVRCN